MINNRQQSGRRRGRGGQGGQRQQNGRPDMGNRIDNRARGNAAQLLEKYKTLAADAQRSGDRVLAEYYFQFADHYFRVLAESRARYEEANPGRQRQDYNDNDGDGFEGEGGEGDGDEGESRERQQRQYRDDRPQREDRGPRDDRQPRQERYQREDRPREDRYQRDDRPRDDRPREERYQRDDRDDNRRTLRANGNGAAPVDAEPVDVLPFDALPPAINVSLEPVEGVEGEPVALPKRRGRPKKVVSEAASDE